MQSVLEFSKMKKEKNNITMVSCYDFTSAMLVEQSGVDCILVGDSVAMVMHGYPNTTYTDVAMMALHIKAVAKGAHNTFIVGDMPFLSYRKSLHSTMCVVEKLVTAGANAIKLEGASGNIETIQHIIASGVPVMGHVGLTPQHIHTLGKLQVQGKNETAAEKITQHAQQLEEAGCFAIVLECIPTSLANAITNRLTIPTIGIGAGAGTNGQVLVYHDLLGLYSNIKPKFVKHFMQGDEQIIRSLKQYIAEVKNNTYPNEEYSYAGM